MTVGSLAGMVLVLLLVVVAMSWVTWVALGRMAILASRGMAMAEEAQRHAWSCEVSRDTERAHVVANLETIGRGQGYQPEVSPVIHSLYGDESQLGRMGS